MTAAILPFTGKRHRIAPRQHHLLMDGRVAMLGAISNGRIEAWVVGENGLEHLLLDPDMVYMRQVEAVMAGEDATPCA